MLVIHSFLFLPALFYSPNKIIYESKKSEVVKIHYLYFYFLLAWWIFVDFSVIFWGSFQFQQFHYLQLNVEMYPPWVTGSTCITSLSLFGFSLTLDIIFFPYKVRDLSFTLLRLQWVCLLSITRTPAVQYSYYNEEEYKLMQMHQK